MLGVKWKVKSLGENMENNISYNENEKEAQEKSNLNDVSFVDIREKSYDEQIEYIASVAMKADNLNAPQKVKNKK